MGGIARYDAVPGNKRAICYSYTLWHHGGGGIALEPLRQPNTLCMKDGVSHPSVKTS